MRVVKDNIAFKGPRDRLVQFFREEGLHYSTDVHLCFVCGAADSPAGQPLSLRQQFLAWAAGNEPKMICVRAESAVTDLLRQQDERGRANNLSVIEETIGEVVHSLLLFPESPGSFAELGLFSANESIRAKMLVALLHQFQGDSFLTLGPIKSVAQHSIFTPQPLILTGDLNLSFAQIRNRLLGEARNSRSYNKRLELMGWSEYSLRLKLFILEKIICLSGILTETDLFDLVHSMFGKYEKSEIRLLIGLLSSMEIVRRTELSDVVYLLSEGEGLFIQGRSMTALEVKASWIECYTANLPEAIDEMPGRYL